MITTFVNRISLKHRIFVRATLFKNTPLPHVHFLKVVCHFIWKDELRLAIYFLKRTGFFLRISLNHLFFHVGCFFHIVAAIHSLRGYMKQLLFKNKYFFGRRISYIRFFKGKSIYFIFWLQPSILWYSGLLSPKEWQSFILWRVLYLLWWENLQSSIVWVPYFLWNCELRRLVEGGANKREALILKLGKWVILNVKTLSFFLSK